MGAVADLSVHSDPPGGERERGRERERERGRKRVPQKIKRKKKDIVLCPANVFILENYRNRGRREHSWKYIYI
jgi:hypothetical protein